MDRTVIGGTIVFATMLICVGTLLAIAGCVAIIMRPASVARAKQVLRLPSVPIADAPIETRIRIDGTVVECDHALIAPCSGEPAVWFRLRLRETFGSGGGGDGGGGALWHTLVDEEDAVAFWVVDRADARAIVEGRNFSASGEKKSMSTLSPEGRDRVRAFLGQRGQDIFSADIYEEEYIRPGDRVSIVGSLHRPCGSAQLEPYRRSTETTISGDASGVRMLIVTAGSLRRDLGIRYRAGLITTALGLLLLSAGTIVQCMTPPSHPSWLIP